MGGPGSGRWFKPGHVYDPVARQTEVARKASQQRRKELMAEVSKVLNLGFDYTDRDPEAEVVPGLQRKHMSAFIADLRAIRNAEACKHWNQVRKERNEWKRDNDIPVYVWRTPGAKEKRRAKKGSK